VAAAGLALLGALAAGAIDPGTARPATGGPFSTVVSIPQAVDRTCFDAPVGNVAGAATFTVTPELGDASFLTLEARLAGPAGGDWDVAVFDQAGSVVAASSSAGPDEVASGYVLDPGPLTVQACRISGAGTAGELSVETVPIQHSEVEKASLAFVETPRKTDEETVQKLGLDLTEHGGEDYLAVILHGPDDKLALEKAGLDYEVQVPNLAHQSARQRAADAAYAAETQRSALPSGRDTYRRLMHYQQELKDLVDTYPEIVRPIELKHETYEGRTVEGVEITTDVDNLRDGKPVFLQMGLHHAREWPSGEHAMEWAYQLVKGYSNGNERVTRLVQKVRTIVIPVVNPDGFNSSREAGQQQGAGNGRDGNDTANFATAGPNEFRRKNCRFGDDSEGGSCLQPAFGLASFGVDPNRNYGAFWGGPGASGSPENETYYGTGPFSEPETQNIRELISARQVTMLITNHTFSDLVLRPPGLASEPDPIDEPQLKALGDAMAAENNYLSQHGFELYDTTGTTEDWSYNSTGGFGYTFEIGCNDPDPTPEDGYNCTGNFHPTFPKVIAEWEGTSPQAEAINGEGNREAYFIAQEAAADPSKHSILEGQAPPGAVLKVEKSFETPTFDSGTFEDNLDSEMKVPDSGNYDFHINPSTRPLVAQDRGRIPVGPPSPDIDLCDPIGDQCAPAPDAHPCGDATTPDPDCFNEHPFDITNGPNEDNDRATVALSWITPTTDWDLFVYRDENDDGDSQDPEDKLVGTSAAGPTTDESTTFVRPQEGLGDSRLLPGPYVARVVNFAAAEPYDATVTFGGPEPPTLARTETWKFSCTYAGEKRISEDILIARGERQKLDLSACGLPGGDASRGGRCQGAKATLVGSKGDDKMVGTNGRDVIIGLGGRDKIKGRGGNDLICAKGGDDRVIGGAGDDTLGAGGGRDRVSGGGGRDKLKGGARADRIAGGAGNDRLIGGGGRDNLNGGGGRDHCGGPRDRARNC
jgi:Zinc carboxypeptidase/RTX calcium-binding nonapeptide repeat (4 copies)